MAIKGKLLLLPVLLVFVLVLCEGYRRLSPMAELPTNISSATSEMADIERELSARMEKGEAVPQVMRENSVFQAIPAEFSSWIHSGDGKPNDPFHPSSVYSLGISESGFWFLSSYGPDRDQDISMDNAKELNRLKSHEPQEDLTLLSYDPSNGSLSSGDLIRLGRTQIER